MENNIAERYRADNSISDASFGYGQGFHSMKRDGADRTISEASATQSLGEVRGLYSKKKIETCPQWRKLWHFFSRQDKNIVREVYPKKRDRADNIISEASTTPSFGDVRGVYSKKKI